MATYSPSSETSISRTSGSSISDLRNSSTILSRSSFVIPVTLMGRLVPYGSVRYAKSQPYLMILALKSSGLVHKYAQNRHDIGVALLIGGQRDLNGISTPFNGERTAPRRPRDGSSTSFDDTSRPFDVSRLLFAMATARRGPGGRRTRSSGGRPLHALAPSALQASGREDCITVIMSRS